MELSQKTEEFLITARGLIQQDDRFLAPSHREDHDQVTKLIILMNQALAPQKDQKLRKAVLRFITKLPIESQKQLTMHTHSVLIDLLEGGNYNDCIQEIANVIKNATQISFIS